MAPVKRVAVIGTGPAGAIAVDALAKEKAFDVIRIFERREAPGGCWLEDPPSHVQQLPIPALSQRTADAPITPPETLPATTPASKQYRFADSSIYPKLETNINADTMQFSREPIPVVRSQVSIQRHGQDTPFRPYKVIKEWVGDMLARDNYSSMISYNTTVELVSKDESIGTWTLILRKPIEGKDEDYWWSETFDAVVVATGHYSVPFIPSVPGLTEFAENNPGVVIHSKQFRDCELYRGKRIVTVGASISAADLAFSLAGVAAPPLHAVVRGEYHPSFGDWAFQHPNIVRKPTISRFESEGGKRTVVFEDGTKLENVDTVIFGTGYSWTLPFLPRVEIRNNRVPGLYQHIFWQKDPTLCFVGAVGAGFTFKIFEYQAVLCARYLAGRYTLPPLSAQLKWEENRIAYKGDGVEFTLISPDFEEHFNELRDLAGEPFVDESGNEVGRRLPKFRQEWMDAFTWGHDLRIMMWQEGNEAARKAMESDVEDRGEIVARLEAFSV